MIYRPEGSLLGTPDNDRLISSAEGLSEAMNKDLILEARVCMCTSSHDMILDLPCGSGIVRREEGAVGITDGSTRDIALISRVNKAVCFKVLSVTTGDDGRVLAELSRRRVQEECISRYISKLVPGDVIGAKVTHLEQFGCFVDIGCGIPSLIPIDTISVSRIAHPSDRFSVGQFIKAAVKSRDGSRICLTHKELLGSWAENAAKFSAGETVGGIVRSVEEYGIFVELAPNIAGLAEPKENIRAGQQVSVYIKAIIPEKMKIKLVIVEAFDGTIIPPPPEYYISSDHISEWRYSTPESERQIVTCFGQ